MNKKQAFLQAQKATKVSNFEIKLHINNTTLTADELTYIIERAIDKEGVIAEVYAVTNIGDDNTAAKVTTMHPKNSK